MRVAGATVSPGRLDSEFSEALLHALRREVHAAAPAGTPDDVVRLELTGVGAGSAILYLEPAQDSRIQTEDELLQAPDPLDDAVRTVLDLHSAAESQADLGRFAPAKDLLRALTPSRRAWMSMIWLSACSGARGPARATRLS